LKIAGIHGDLVAHHRHHAHALGAAGEHQVGFAEADAIGGHRHGLQAGRAEAVDGDAGHGVGQAGQQHADARHVHALLGLGHGAADDGVADAVRIDARRLRHHGADHVGEHVVRTGVAEYAARRLADRGAGGGDDVGVLHLLGHGFAPLRRKVERRRPVIFLLVIPAKPGRFSLDSGVRPFSVSSAAVCRWSWCGRCGPGFFGLRQFHEMLALQREQPFLVDREPRSITPPHRVSAMRVAMSTSCSEAK
jgi:hypothetical protein